MTATIGRAPEDAFHVRDHKGEIAKARETIFPILIRDSADVLRAVGTGFYIANGGLFATAAHVLEESLDGEGNVVKGMEIAHRVGDQVYWRPIMQFSHHFVADVAIGIASPMKHITTGELLQNKYLSLSNFAPYVGEVAVTFAYPATVVTDEPPIVNVDPGWYAGQVMEHLPRGRDRMLPGACYRTSIVIHGGASGGPVFDRRGRVFAVNSTGFGDDAVSYVSCISSILELHVEGVVHPETKELTNLHAEELARRKIIVFE